MDDTTFRPTSIVISTVGTSALTNRTTDGDRRRDYEPGTQAWKEAAVHDFRQRLGKYDEARASGDADTARACLGQVSAELSSLASLRHDSGSLGHVVFLTSATTDGRKAGEIVHLTARSHWPEDAFDVRTCEGLDPEDPNTFLAVGLRNLHEEVRRIADANPEAALSLNITGGLKAGIPFMTAVAMEMRLPLVYLFDRSPAIVRIDGGRLRERMEAGGHQLAETGAVISLSTLL